MAEQISPFTVASSGVRIKIKLAPKARRNLIRGIAAGKDGRVLKVAVTAAPQKGKANAALIKMLAREWRLPKTSMSLIAGTKSRQKTLLIEGDTKILIKSLEQWLEQING